MDTKFAQVKEWLADQRQELMKEENADPGLVGAIRKELRKTEAAISRIEDGSYGICYNCGDPIDQGRLRRWPVVLDCQNCQDNREIADDILRDRRERKKAAEDLERQK